MSGHSKWANIKHKKAAADAQKGKIFAKLIRELTIAARMGGSDPDHNPRLRKAMDKAKDANMPMETVERAIKRGSGATGADNYEEVYYEGYGPAGVAVLIRCLTDNRNRTVGEIKHILSKNGGSLAEKNAVAWLFERKGVISGEVGGASQESIFDAAIEAGAEDASFEDTTFEIATEPSLLSAVEARVRQTGATVQSAEVTFVPKNTVPLAGEEAERLLRLISALEDLDDVQEVFSNYNISRDVMEKVLAEA
ncbi:MAG: YebC/PmpR family DNA-binding transcriptional regulator [bacterium JZ-2024 1]